MILTVLIVLLTTVIPVIIVTYDQHTVADPGIEGHMACTARARNMGRAHSGVHGL